MYVLENLLYIWWCVTFSLDRPVGAREDIEERRHRRLRPCQGLPTARFVLALALLFSPAELPQITYYTAGKEEERERETSERAVKIVGSIGSRLNSLIVCVIIKYFHYKTHTSAWWLRGAADYFRMEMWDAESLREITVESRCSLLVFSACIGQNFIEFLESVEKGKRAW